MENIIKKAIEGGYFIKDDSFALALDSGTQTIEDGMIISKKTQDGRDESSRSRLGDINLYKIICDPLFWQALGKACEWKDEEREYKGGIQVIPGCRFYAIGFCRRNFGGSFESAVKWLENIIK